jgi:hypothetical protein
MNFKELQRHAEENGLAVPAAQMGRGQVAVVLRWLNDTSSFAREQEGSVVVRESGADHWTIIARSGRSRDPSEVGAYWGNPRNLVVLRLTPELPYDDFEAYREEHNSSGINSRDLTNGRVAVVLQWSGWYDSFAGALVAKERTGRIVVIRNAPDEPDRTHGAYWSADERGLIVKPVALELPYDVPLRPASLAVA